MLKQGPFGIAALKPQALFGLDLPPLMHGVMWSLALNIAAYIVVSLARQPSSIEHLQADLFVPPQLAPAAPNFRRWRTTVTVEDLMNTVGQYLGPDRTRDVIRSVRERQPSRAGARHAGGFPAAAPCRASDRVRDRRRIGAAGDVAVAAQAHGVGQDGPEAAGRCACSLALQPGDPADRAQSRAAGHRRLQPREPADLLEPPVRRDPRPAAALDPGRRHARGNSRQHQAEGRAHRQRR